MLCSVTAAAAAPHRRKNTISEFTIAHPPSGRKKKHNANGRNATQPFTRSAVEPSCDSTARCRVSLGTAMIAPGDHGLANWLVHGRAHRLANELVNGLFRGLVYGTARGMAHRSLHRLVHRQIRGLVRRPIQLTTRSTCDDRAPRFLHRLDVATTDPLLPRLAGVVHQMVRGLVRR